MLLYGIRIPYLSGHQFNSLIAVILAAAILSTPNALPLIMSNGVLVTLGDISYSIYLVHWPLISWYRYENMGMDEIDVTSNFSMLFRASIHILAGLYLLMSSITLGYVVEKAFQLLVRYIRSWSDLLLIIFMGYLISTLLLLHLERNAIRLEESSEDEEELERVMKLPFILPPNTSIEPTSGVTHEEMVGLNRRLIFGVLVTRIQCHPNSGSEKVQLLP